MFMLNVKRDRIDAEERQKRYVHAQLEERLNRCREAKRCVHAFLTDFEFNWTMSNSKGLLHLFDLKYY